VVTAAPGAAILPATVFAPDSRALTALGIDPVAFGRADQAARVIAGALDKLRDPDTVVVMESAHLSPGGTYPVVFADGRQVALQIVGVVADGSIRGDLLLSRETVRRHDASALTAAVYLDREVPAGAGARVIDVATWAAETDSAEDRLVWLFTLMLIGVSAGYGAVAVANTLLMAAQGRAPDLRVVRLAGTTRRQVAGYVAAESALVVVIGALLGGAVAFGALLAIRAGLSEQTGAPVPLVVPWPVIGGVVGLCLLLALVAGVLPTRRMLHAPALRLPRADL
jgi:putative ABC transport system permease protein